mmetsp:Transcript_21124/g.46405  ORF Transcript_21124/g.46405 Transcript_21124/m.46405 type:complete len:568 (+) Transcript_21124:18-1721(+)|eukprot:CAMPEP_0204329280 /NCGR_PEP_ID=MMETSP0469-20131031/14032_1 /ASSEMBLY_ACC=CAM_ASM_000384 /TAXON_ID=2969 /ORGANISM="Oxyrrhis marina" /LENGTH=567 /DNA_ID=CAMNT_0051311857 /DNA_START=12 /DNA_END=1715 /DNA_ORIENTATION=-
MAFLVQDPRTVPIQGYYRSVPVPPRTGYMMTSVGPGSATARRVQGSVTAPMVRAPMTVRSPVLTSSTRIVPNAVASVPVKPMPAFPFEDAAVLYEDPAFRVDLIKLCHAHGIVTYPDPVKPMSPCLAPIGMFPAPFSKARFDEVRGLGPAFNNLIDACSCDPKWLCESLQTTAEHDPFTAKFVELCRKVYINGGKEHSSDLRAYLLRQDYLLHDVNEGRILQVEVNTISSAFAGLIEELSKVQRIMGQKYLPDIVGSLPQANQCGTGFAKALSNAHRAYQARYRPARKTVVLFLVLDTERNEIDQRKLEIGLANEGVTCRRRSLDDLVDSSRLDGDCFVFLDGSDEVEVSVVYMRSGYGPENYEGEGTWDVRERFEWSRAAKCPSVPAQLTGTKRVQQLWADPAVLTKFGVDAGIRQRMARVFARQVNPAAKDEKSQAVVREAQDDPSRWVLKPQREGGGHNLHGEQIQEALSKDDCGQYVLMEKICPAPHQAAMVDQAKSVATGDLETRWIDKAVSELGIYTVVVADGRRRVQSDVVGHMLRTKDQSTSEGGVNAGFAVLNTPVFQ